NITPDKDTGIGNWTKDQFWHALHDGIDAEGAHLYPAFPYLYFAHLKREDVDAIYAYLKTVKPIRNTPPRNRLIFPANIRFAMTFWDWLFLDQSPLTPDPARSAQWNRGYEIVNGAGHCGACHTPKTFLFNDVKSKALSGETMDGWYAPNLTATRPLGLGNWSVADIELYLATGQNRFGRVVGAMKDVVESSTSKLSDQDRAAIAVYLKSLPAAPAPTPVAPTQAQMDAGSAVFVQSCSVCHGHPDQGYPALAQNATVGARDPSTVLRVILQGSQSMKPRTGAIGFSMPAFATLSDGELADVATYIRNAFGNRAGAVSEKQARDLRKLLGPGN
ncbi:MAG: cytochrome c, partial [Alphaproteobacteria bacterium]|nr:cytochrome c [Alphaproteobacteria bacterium]